MKRNRFRNLVIITATLVLTGAGIALAHDGWGGRNYRGGYGGHMMDYGSHMRGYGGHMMGPGYGPAYGDLDKEDYAKLEKAREKFFDQTRDLRRELDEQRFALEKAWSAENSDTAKIKALQGDISKLRSEFDAKRVAYELEVRQMMPESARGRNYASGYRGGYCW